MEDPIDLALRGWNPFLCDYPDDPEALKGVGVSYDTAGPDDWEFPQGYPEESLGTPSQRLARDDLSFLIIEREGSEEWVAAARALERFVGERRKMPYPSDRYRGIKVGRWWASWKWVVNRLPVEDPNPLFSLKRAWLMTLPQWRADDAKIFHTRKANAQRWDVHYATLTVFLEDHGRFPRREDGQVYNGERVLVGRWVTAQIHYHQIGKMSADEWKRLGRLPCWEAFVANYGTDWLEWCELTREYRRRYGAPPPPRAKQGKAAVGEWLQLQVQNKALLSPSQLELLATIVSF